RVEGRGGDAPAWSCPPAAEPAEPAYAAMRTAVDRTVVASGAGGGGGTGRGSRSPRRVRSGGAGRRSGGVARDAGTQAIRAGGTARRRAAFDVDSSRRRRRGDARSRADHRRSDRDDVVAPGAARHSVRGGAVHRFTAGVAASERGRG